MISATILIITIIFAIYLQGKKKVQKILGVYSQPGRWYWIKYIAILTVLWLRTSFAKLKKPSETELEKIKELSDHEKAFEAVFFQAASQSGIYLCGGIERRHQAKVNALFYIVVPDFGLLESPKMPNTLLNADPSSLLLLKDYAAEGIRFLRVEPMKKWIISYEGKMRSHQNPDKLFDVKLEGEWTSNFPYFLFERDMSLKATARGIAREEWNEQRFKSLKEAHQTHYEQMGFYKGVLKVDGKEYPLNIDAFRDHSYGHKRDWTLMHRYVFHMFYLEDQTRVSVGVVSQPCTTSYLELGYVVLPDQSLHPIASCDLLLYQHGENGSPPNDYAFSFIAGGVTYEANIKIIHQNFHYKGNNVEAKLFERFLECDVNGVKGRGISEWHYNITERLQKAT